MSAVGVGRSSKWSEAQLFGGSPAGGQQRGLVQHVRQVGAGGAQGDSGDLVQVHIGTEWQAGGVQLEDRDPAGHTW